MRKIIFSLLLIQLACQKDAEPPKGLDIDVLTPSPNTQPEVEKPLELVWSDEFDGTELNLEDWSFDLGDGCPDLCGWGNSERQVYTDTNHRLEDGFLIISAKNEEQYTSTRIITKGKREFRYGRIESRLKLPTGGGLWPAFWALGNDIDNNPWPDCGEIDIMEYVGRAPGQVFNAIHTRSSYGATVNTKITNFPNVEDDFHVFAMEWKNQHIDFFLDDEKVYTYAPAVRTYENWPFNKPFFLILNMAIGGTFGGSIDTSLEFPREYIIDYVRVYQ
ncbi:glycoside hydrolase family 16 protein [Flavobacteriaceae bacterium]|nr:glycoside hydrolase family 16 protein [Flavobacteriaceae bacterium]MDC3354819.1 glycoside hydrolase family 16 protein [Flavobacteriaceae bacterium]